MEGQHQMLRIEAERDVQQAKQQVQLINPASASSSPSHEFSFTISLHPSTAAKLPKSSPPPFSAAIDLSPADEIFFHGHLLPLHLLSNLPVSPRSSTNSLDSFTLPIKELLHDTTTTPSAADKNRTSSTSSSEEYESRHVMEEKGRGKSKSFSLFGIPKRKKKHDQEIKDDHHQKQRRSKFEMLKRYMRFIKPFLSLRNKRGNSDEFLRQQPCSYSGNLRLKPNKKELRGRREFSAPASMITSPTNSGLLVASGAATPTAASDSTMEELQAAIQAAIAHCKNSIATEDKMKVP
ncbi:hypothetical protein ACS0TY_013340 [Phlomoides rotata]